MSIITWIDIDGAEVMVEVEYDYQPPEPPQRELGGGWIYPGCGASVDVILVREQLDGHLGPRREWGPDELPIATIDRIEEKIADEESSHR